MLFQSLDARLLDESGLPVVYGDGSSLMRPFHAWPDVAAMFTDPCGLVTKIGVLVLSHNKC